MAGSAWSVEETRALLNLWGDDRVQRQLEGSWKLFLTIGLCPHTLQVSYDGRAVDRDNTPPPPAYSSHQFRVRVYARDYAIIHRWLRLLGTETVYQCYQTLSALLDIKWRMGLGTRLLSDGSLMPRLTTRTYNTHLRQIHPTLRRVYSCQDWQQEHITHTQGRYSPLTDGSTHAEWQQEHIMHTQGRYIPLTDGSTHA